MSIAVCGGYYKIDADAHAKLHDWQICDTTKFYQNHKPRFEAVDHDITATIRSISDIVTVGRMPAGSEVTNVYEVRYTATEKLDNDVACYEHAHSSDLDNFDQILEALKEFLKEALSAKSMTGYTAGEITRFKSYAPLQSAIIDARATRASLSGVLKVAGENEKTRFDELIKEREELGWRQTISSGVEVLGGAVVIVVSIASLVGTVGADSPLAIAGIIGGVGMITHGGSDMAEGINNITLANSGNILAVAGNPIKDHVFGGNQTAWNILGVASSVLGVAGSFGASTLAAVGDNTGAAAARIVTVRVTTLIAAGVASVGGNFFGNEVGTKLFGPEAGYYIGLGTGIAAGAIVAGLGAGDIEDNVSELHPGDTGVRTIEFNGKTIIQEDNLFDPNAIDNMGRTNIERMQQGLAPKGIDGKPINLHHLDQTEAGPITEISETSHVQNSGSLHQNTGQELSLIDRNAFATWRRGYWKARASTL